MKKTTKEFILDAKKVHGDRYDYSLVDYIGSIYKVKIICKEHGEFEQNPQSHRRGSNCPKCIPTYMDIKMFIEKAKLVHGDTFKNKLLECL